MRGVRFTKAEGEYLTELVKHAACSLESYQGDLAFGDKVERRAKLVRGIEKKLAAASQSQPPGVAAAPLQDALVLASRGKVVPVEANGFGRVSRQATAAGATPEKMALVGNWIATQGWLQGPLTIYTVLAQWGNWLARAKATAAPDGLEEGLAGHLGQSPETKRPASTAGRRKAGLG